MRKIDEKIKKNILFFSSLLPQHPDSYSRKPKDKKTLALVAFLQNTTIDYSGVSQGYNHIFCDLKVKGQVAFHIF